MTGSSSISNIGQTFIVNSGGIPNSGNTIAIPNNQYHNLQYQPGYTWDASTGTWINLNGQTAIGQTTIGTGIGNYPIGGNSVWASGDLIGQTYPYKIAGQNSWAMDVERAYCNGLLEAKNYSMMCTLAETVLRTDRSMFMKFERTILKSNDFLIIMQFIRSCVSIDMKHLTSVLLKAYKSSTITNKNVHLSSFMSYSADRVNFNKILQLADKENNVEYLEWIVSSQYSEKNVTSLLSKQDIDFNKIEKVFLKSINSQLIYQFAKCFKNSNRKKCFARIRQLKDTATMRLFIDQIDDDFCRSLQNMR